MNGEELEQALHRALEHVFQVPGPIIETFSKVFTSYPLDKLKVIDDERKLKRILDRISKRRDVLEMQEWINVDIQAGKETLDSVVAAIVLNNLPDAGILPRDKVYNYGDYELQEVWALSVKEDSRPQKVAMGQFPVDVPLDKIMFTPDNVFYNENMQWTIEPGKQPYLKFDGEVVFETVARTIVFRDKANKHTARKTVKEVIKYSVNELFERQSIVTKPYQKYENMLIESIRSFFPSIVNQNRSINYRRLNSIFRLARRRNISLEPYIRDSAFAGKIIEGIEQFVPLPYAVVRIRTKQRESAFEKTVQAFYDLQTEGYEGGAKSFRDMYGIRILLPTVDDVHKYVNQLKKTLGLKVVVDERGKPVEKDHIKKPKPNGYQSYHIAVEFAGREYDLQIRTHEMDVYAERIPEQAHGGAFLEEKTRLIETTPLPVRRVIRTLLGLYTTTKKAA